MRVIVAILAVAGRCCSSSRSAGATTTSQKLRKSETVVAWYEGKGRWHLRPGYTFCADLSSPSRARPLLASPGEPALAPGAGATADPEPDALTSRRAGSASTPAREPGTRTPATATTAACR